MRKRFRNRHQGWQCLVVVLLATIGAPQVYADVIVRVDGVITSVNNDWGLLPFSARVGDPFSIRYVLNPALDPDGGPQDPEYNAYWVLTSFTFTTGGQSLGATLSHPGTVEITDSPSGDSWRMQTWSIWGTPSESTPDYPDVRYDGLLIANLNDSAFSSTALAEYPPMDSLLGSTVWFFGSSFVTPDPRYSRMLVESIITGSITNVTPVPLPAAAWLFVSGLSALGFATRRKRD